MENEINEYCVIKKFLSFNLRHYLFGDFSIECVKDVSGKGYNIGQQRCNLTITVTGAIASTKFWAVGRAFVWVTHK